MKSARAGVVASIDSDLTLRLNAFNGTPGEQLTTNQHQMVLVLLYGTEEDKLVAAFSMYITYIGT